MMTLVCTTAVQGADAGNPLSKLDEKIHRNLANEKWSPASKTFVGVLWEDFRNAYQHPAEETGTRSIFGKMPEIADYEDYLGAFGRGQDSKKPFIAIVKDEGGKFQIKLEGHTVPAVQKNKTVVFTTGDVIHSAIPTFSEKPYCTLEMYFIVRTEGQFYFGSPSTLPDQWIPLSKLKQE